ncbi:MULTISPECIES: glycosyltransferase family 1 protein [Prochlorococcus]|uniref:Glycosyltransferase n=1 Tax=Prochlorococcus marinus (strain SARG / CCMP1375 / SS120) TaxID=167539 RepID=Q7VEF6_PROMA|nr:MULTISPECIES: glycosyltransferase family 1 protein [Prochlorococcus]KGG22355.1 Glycosyltransferase [Prochlorococcus marinus str. SS2]AAP99103.1 Glycosyltransferase [Prochlorococcus marinus subsp. marinus str. CCMP1375]KGG11637.1 Glycosyltransferase [Prochlorococcus marinus str. LG]KGG22691.1 Glycosyltransferase [Prochlorococcus marinus str. SS35]KGG32888.1 Glycosyltransferase [Prochlorococcus marinus str. SS51]
MNRCKIRQNIYNQELSLLAHIVLLSTADWDHPLWTNKQHVACSLADEGHYILYVESLGLRSVNATSKDWIRIFKRLIKGLSPPRNVYKNIWVWSPLVIPGSSKGIFLIINKFMLFFGIYIARKILRLRCEWLWTYNPLTTKLLNIKNFSQIIYHAVDAIQEQPNMPREIIESEEKKLCLKANNVFVTSPAIYRRLKPYSHNIKYYSNCCDYNHFSKALNIKRNNIPEDLMILKSPVIGFVGAISNYKLDFSLIYELAKNNKMWNFVFIGPVSEGEANTDTSLIDSLPNIHLFGYRPYSVLPSYCAGFDLAWLPLQKNPYTHSMFPMKFFEYLAAGLPVVATSIDSLQEFSNEAILCEVDYKHFESAIKSSLTTSYCDLELRLNLAKQYTYKKRTQSMLHDIQELINA